MNTAWFSLFDMAVCGIPALGVGAWQLISVNREIAKDKIAKDKMGEDKIGEDKIGRAAHTAAPASPDDARHPIGEH